MPILVIGGHSRSVGKTSVVAGLISALPEFHWTAFKITQYGHGICSANGAACDCATDDHAWAVSEERNRDGESDSSRFLVAGAERAWWVRTEQGRLAEAMPRVRQILAGTQNAIIESNSILRFLKPDLYLTVLDPSIADFKNSAQTFLDRADAVLLHPAEDSSSPAWERVSLKPVANRPIFAIRPPQYVTPEVVQYVRERLSTVLHRTEDPSLAPDDRIK
ncbi:MAG: hypothetical protein HY010_02960 [Acidobacteria bacterium]|nr:hypothetical protein [Acidobacteriota bacterium]